MDWVLGVAVYRNMQATTASSNYQLAEGLITRCEKKRNSVVGQVIVEYSFWDNNNDGQRYTTDRISHPIAKSNRQAHEYHEWKQSFPVGKAVVVFYDPADPQATAVLRPGMQGFYLMDAMLLTVFHALFMAVLSAILTNSSQNGDPPSAIFFLALALLCFVMVSLVGATLIPTVNVMFWAWSFVLAGASGISIVYSSRVRRSRLAIEKR
jgi:hypothetical protein